MDFGLDSPTNGDFAGVGDGADGDPQGSAEGSRDDLRRERDFRKLGRRGTEDGEVAAERRRQLADATHLPPAHGPNRHHRVCPFFLRGVCKFGANCRYIHEGGPDGPPPDFDGPPFRGGGPSLLGPGPPGHGRPRPLRPPPPPLMEPPFLPPPPLHGHGPRPPPPFGPPPPRGRGPPPFLPPPLLDDMPPPPLPPPDFMGPRSDEFLEPILTEASIHQQLAVRAMADAEMMEAMLVESIERQRRIEMMYQQRLAAEQAKRDESMSWERGMSEAKQMLQEAKQRRMELQRKAEEEKRKAEEEKKKAQDDEARMKRRAMRFSSAPYPAPDRDHVATRDLGDDYGESDRRRRNDPPDFPSRKRAFEGDVEEYSRRSRERTKDREREWDRDRDWDRDRERSRERDRDIREIRERDIRHEDFEDRYRRLQEVFLGRLGFPDRGGRFDDRVRGGFGGRGGRGRSPRGMSDRRGDDRDARDPYPRRWR